MPLARQRIWRRGPEPMSMAEIPARASALPPMSRVVSNLSSCDGLAAAGALLANGSMSSEEIVLVLLIGNILSSPIRAIRHQYPYYAGIFKPVLAAELIFFSQSFRAFSIALVTILYYIVAL